ncbi:MAG TPA: hypothetical protein VFB26_00825 [Gaiellaceae bacterium]|nr:hypothetical protein [Gaiellaceae bacterium]
MRGYSPLSGELAIRPEEDADTSVAADAAGAPPPYPRRTLKTKPELWVAAIGFGLLVLALGGWAVDAVRWSLASAREQWRLSLSAR